MRDFYFSSEEGKKYRPSRIFEDNTSFCRTDYTYILMRPSEIADEEADMLIARIPGPGTFSVAVVGESHYQTALASICGGHTEEGHDVVVEAHLVLEDSNPHDPDAVRVDINGETVGYLSRENARQYRIRLSEEGYPLVVGKCTANIRGGWDRGGGDKGYFGVWLDLPTTS